VLDANLQSLASHYAPHTAVAAYTRPACR